MANKVVGTHDHLVGFSPNIREDLSSRRLHNAVSDYLSNGYGVIYAAESLFSSSFPRDESERIEEQRRHKAHAILNNLAKYAGPNKVDAYLKKGLLAIKDPNDILATGASVKQLLNSVNSLVQNYEPQHSNGIKGKVFFNAPDNFFQEGKFDKFLQFEQGLGTKLNDNFQMICWYRKKWIRSLSFTQLIHLLEAHNTTIHKDIQFQTWNVDRTIEVISEGINKAVEQKHASGIILETMHRRFNLDKPAIISSPNLFVDTLKIMSPDSAENIIDTVMEEFESKLSFGSNCGLIKKSDMQKRGELRGNKMGTSTSRSISSSKKNRGKVSNKGTNGKGKENAKDQDH